ncbi:hypothetical protein HanIR_Chr07g0335681 [Helianthus annuus]|nr:hypothetical protein HanIR_Chr07g0335681 [Helianthus annuus]
MFFLLFTFSNLYDHELITNFFFSKKLIFFTRQRTSIAADDRKHRSLHHLRCDGTWPEPDVLKTVFSL